MSLVQVCLLRRKRTGENTDILNFALGATIKGIAAGLHSTASAEQSRECVTVSNLNRLLVNLSL
jgi:hypothetical protein